SYSKCTKADVEMNAKLWTRVREVLHELLDAEPQARAAILERIGGSDPELRREAESLLAQELEAAKLDLTARAAAGFDDGELDCSAPPKHLGPFRLIRQLGRGGMGVVWLAERDDGEFTKRVAIKILPPFFASPDLEARFRRERQILAGLEHPNI